MKLISKTIIIVFALMLLPKAKAADIDYARELITVDGHIYKIDNISNDESVIIASGEAGYLLLEVDQDGEITVTKD